MCRRKFAAKIHIRMNSRRISCIPCLYHAHVHIRICMYIHSCMHVCTCVVFQVEMHWWRNSNNGVTIVKGDCCVCACVFFCVMSERINSGEILTGGQHLRSADVGVRGV